MILKCSHCGKRMRVDDKSVPPGKHVKVRCPYCQGVGVALLPPPEAAAAPLKQSAVAERPQEAQQGAGSAAAATEQEPPIPADAFNSFRFPSEEGGVEPQRTAMSSKLRLFLWIGASAGVVLLFALLVNLVLPGPPR